MSIDFEDKNTGVKEADLQTQSLGFDLLQRMQVRSSVGSAATVEKFLENAEEFIKATGKQVSMYKFSKEEFKFLEYSNIVITKESKGTIIYFILELASTGVAGQTPKAIMEFEMSKNDVFAKSRASYIVLPSEAIEKNLRNEIEITIANGKETNFVFAGGDIIHATEDITDTSVSATALADAINQIESLDVVISGEYTDASLYEAVKSKGIRDLKVSVSNEPLSLLGETRHKNFSTNLTLRDMKQQAGINLGSGSLELAITHGYVSVSVYEKPVTTMDQNGRPVNTSVFTFFPLVNVNAMELAIPTTGAALIALAQSAVVTQDHRWVNILAETTATGKNPGVLELIKNEAVSGTTKLVDLTSKNFTTSDKERYILEKIDNNPVLQMSIPGFGFGTSTMSIFAIASNPEHPDNQDARTELIKVAHDVTGGQFPLDFDPSKIFASASFKLPYGTYINKNKDVRSLDEIDLMYILDKKNGASIDTISNFITSEVANNNNDLMRMKVYTDLKLNANITGFKDTVTFNPDFITLLASSMNSAGAGFSVESSGVQGQTNYGFASTADLYAAGLGNAQITGFNNYGNNNNNVNGNFFGNQYNFNG